jgi:RimJ/RimL family protein N-acetyltransferase
MAAPPYDRQDLDALLREHPKLIVPKKIVGPNLTARPAEPDDAAFILSLRTDPLKSRYISPTSEDVEKQRQWLSGYSDIYLVFEHEGRPVGTARLYEQRGTSHTWGSWILTNDRPSGAAAESALMVYWLSHDLWFTCVRYEVSKPNEQCWGLLEALGGKRVGENDLQYLYEQSPAETLKTIKTRGLSFSADW